MKNFSLLTLTVLVVLWLSATGFGQQTTGSVEGVVKDANGAVVPGVEITLTGTSVGFNRSIQSDSNGAYRFQQVPPGTYKVITTADKGFAAGTLDGVTVTIEKTTSANITLGIQQNVNTVDVSSDPLGVAVDSTDSKVQTNITAQLIEQLPKGGSFTSLLKVSPGTRSEPLAGGFQVDGASGAENSYIIDGQTVENFRTGTLNANNNIPTSLVQEVQVKTGGFEAEHGGASGGVITVATKGGSDTWHGEFGSVFEPGKLQAGPRSALQSYHVPTSTTADYPYLIRQNRDDSVNWFPTASLGGPIIKSHLWFYGNYSPQIFESSRTTNFLATVATSDFATGGYVPRPRLDASGNPVSPIQYRRTQKNEYAFARLDGSLFNKLRLSATYLWNPIVIDGQLPFASVTNGGNPGNVKLGDNLLSSADFYSLQGGRQNSNNITTQAVYTPTSNLVVTFRYTRGFLNEKPAAYGIPNALRYRCQGLPAGYSSTATGCPTGIGFQNITNNSLVSQDVSLKNEYNADASYFLNDLVGAHEFKVGYQNGTTMNDVLSGNVATGIVSLYYGSTFNQLGQTQIGRLTVAEQTGSAISTCPQINTTTCLGVGTFYRFGTKGIAENRYQAIYFQDKWRPTERLTLNLGLRFESENLPAFNTGGNTGGVPLNFGWGKKIAPRLGGAYDLFGDGKTKVFASYGWFYDRLKFYLPRGSFGGDFYRIDYFRITSAHPNYDYYTPGVVLGSWTDPIGGGNPSTTGGISEQQSDNRIPSNLTDELKAELGLCVPCGVAQDIKPFRQSEFTVGFERELSREYVVSARYTRKNVDSAIEDHAVVGLGLSESYYIGNPGEGAMLEGDKTIGYVKSAKAQRLYNGVEVVLNKRLSKNYFFNVNYTWSRLFGNYPGLASSDEASKTTGIGRLAPGASRSFDYVINGYTATGEPDNGLLPTDRTHTLKAYGGYLFDWRGNKTNSTELSFFQQAFQGTPQTTFISVVATDIVLSKRGDMGRTKPFYQTDLSLTHRYKFGRDSRFTLAVNVDVLNLFNNNSPLLLDTTRYRNLNGISAEDIDPSFDAETQAPTAVLNKVLNGQIVPLLQQLDNGTLPSLGTDGNPISKTYGSPVVFQEPRNVRFGFRLLF